MSSISEAVLDAGLAAGRGKAAAEAAGLRPVVRDKTASRAFLSVVDQALVSGTNFFTTVAIGRLCSKHDLGVYYLAFTILLLARGVQFQLVSGPYMIYWSRRPVAQRGSYLASTLVHQLVFTLVLTAGISAYLGYLWHGGGTTGLLPVGIVMLFAMPFLMLREFIRNLAISHLRMKEAIVIDGLASAVQLGLLATFAALHVLTIPMAYVAMGLSCVVCSLGWIVRPSDPLHFVGGQLWGDWKRNWTFGKWALASHLVGGSMPYIMPWIVAVAHGEADTGVLAAAGTLVGLSNMFVQGLGNFLSPKAALAFSEGGVHALVRVLVRFGFALVATLGAFAVTIAVLGNRLAVLLYGHQYDGIGTIITLLAIAVVANGLRMTIGTGLWSIERPRANFIADLCTMAGTIIVALLLVGPLGVTGAAIGTLSGALAGAFAGAAMLLRSLESLRCEAGMCR